MSTYSLTVTVRHSGRDSWHVQSCHGLECGAETIDVPEGLATVTVAPASYVEAHPRFDGSDEGVAIAILAWAASVAR